MKFPIGSMTVGDILDRGLNILLSRLGVFYAINLIVLAPIILVALSVPAITINTNNPMLAALLGLVLLILLIILQPIGTAAILRIIAQEYIDRRVTMGEALSFAMSRFGKLLGTSILAGLLIFLWTLLFIIPGILAALSYSLIGQIVVVEGLSSSFADFEGLAGYEKVRPRSVRILSGRISLSPDRRPHGGRSCNLPQPSYPC